MQTPIKVVQWATGGVGKAAIEGVLSHPDLELVGCWVHSAEKHGKDVGEIVGTGPVGVVATTSVEELLALDADCVVYSPLVPNDGEVAALLRSGKSVVTPVGWIYPDPAKTVAIEDACRDGRSTLHGTGIHPGGITERFPLMISGVSARVTHVRAEEFSDIRTYGAPDVIRHVMVFGGTPEEALASPMAALLGGGFRASVRMVVAEMGFDADPHVETIQEVAVATAPIDSPIGVIEPGLVAARRFHWRALVGGPPGGAAPPEGVVGGGALGPARGVGPAGGGG